MKLIRILIGAIRLARKPDDYDRVEKFREILRRYQYFVPAVNELNENPETRALMQARPLLDWNTNGFENFLSLPKETLGYQLADFLKTSGLRPLSYTRDATLSDEEFYLRRIVQTHDIWHVVLGYKTDELGEIGINSFMLAQIGWPPAGFYIGGYIFKQMLKSPQKISEVIDVVSVGWARGRSAKPLFAVEWERHFRRPLSEIRKELGVAINPPAHSTNSSAVEL